MAKYKHINRVVNMSEEEGKRIQDISREVSSLQAVPMPNMPGVLQASGLVDCGGGREGN
jgi:hypothetical protein